MIEVPNLDDGNVLKKNAAAIPARESALQVALKSEQNARKYYAEIAERTSDSKLRKLYQELAEFETDHVEFLERKLSETAAENDRTN
jgi:rubrerythrin